LSKQPFFKRMFSARAAPGAGAEHRSDSVTWEELTRMLSGPPTKSGVNVSETTAMNIAGVSAAVRIISESIASLSLFVYRREDDAKTRAHAHPVYRIVHDEPNETMDAFTFWNTIMNHVLLWGNGYAKVERGKDGQVKRLSLWHPAHVEVKLTTNNRGRVYKYRDPITNTPDDAIEDEMLHLIGMSFDGLKGLSTIGMARESLGLTAAAEQFGAEFFGNGTNTGGVLEHPGELSEDAQNRLKKTFAAKYTGINNAHGVMVLEEGMKFSRTTIPPEDAQFLQTRKFQINEIARWFRVPPHLLADLERSTNNNIEHQSIEFVTHTIRPWVRRLEQAMNRKLLTQTEREQFFIEFELDSLLRGDIKSRYEAYKTAVLTGWFSVNDVRKRENENPIPNGNEYLRPMNMNVLGKEEDKKDGEGNQEPAAGTGGGAVG
jgi:HK97 family phage portal protein